MNERQKRRRAIARLEAKAAGRAWLTGAEAREKKANENQREHMKQRINVIRRKHNLTPLQARNVETYQEGKERRKRADMAAWQTEREETDRAIARGWQTERNAAHRSKIAAPVRIVDTPAPMIGAFKRLDI